MSTARQLARLNEQYIQGLMNGDAGWFKHHLAEEFVCIESDGTIRDKADFVRKVGAGPAYAKYRLEQVQVRVFGEVALVQATRAFTGSDGVNGTSHYTDVYLRMDHEWKVVSAQSTRAKASSTAPGSLAT